MVYINQVYIQTILLNLDGCGVIKICLMDIEILICNLDEISVRSCGETGKLPTICRSTVWHICHECFDLLDTTQGRVPVLWRDWCTVFFCEAYGCRWVTIWQSTLNFGPIFLRFGVSICFELSFNFTWLLYYIFISGLCLLVQCCYGLKLGEAEE